MEKRGQASIEYIIMVGMLLLFLIPVVHYASIESVTQVKMSQIDSALERMYRSSEAMNALGPGSQEIITITLPPGIEEITIDKYAINFKVSMFAGTSDFGYVTAANVTGGLPTLPGTYHVLIQHMPGGFINISVKP